MTTTKITARRRRALDYDGEAGDGWQGPCIYGDNRGAHDGPTFWRGVREDGGLGLVICDAHFTHYYREGAGAQSARPETPAQRRRMDRVARALSR